MNSSNNRRIDTFGEINITPLTDIFLVLLIIMMVIAPMLHEQGLNLAIPTEHEAQKNEKEPKIITVNIMKDDKYDIDGKFIEINDLSSHIKNAFNEETDGLLIKADEESSHGAVVKVMDIAQTVGINNISVVEKY